MTLVEKIEKLFGPVAEGLGQSIVQVSMHGKVLQVLLERVDGAVPTIEECEKASRAFSAHLDVEDIIKERYFLEVGSAGMDRPLVKPADFKRFRGREAKVELKFPIDESGRKAIKGKIESAEARTVTIGGIKVDLDNIQKAKLIITDEQFRQILKERKE